MDDYFLGVFFWSHENRIWKLSASLASLQGIFPNLKKAFELFENNRRHCEVSVFLKSALWVEVVVEVPWFLLEVNYSCKYSSNLSNLSIKNNHLLTFYLPFTRLLPSIYPPFTYHFATIFATKSRTLNPCWGEIFELPVAKPGVPPGWLFLTLEVGWMKWTEVWRFSGQTAKNPSFRVGPQTVSLWGTIKHDGKKLAVGLNMVSWQKFPYKQIWCFFSGNLPRWCPSWGPTSCSKMLWSETCFFRGWGDCIEVWRVWNGGSLDLLMNPLSL